MTNNFELPLPILIETPADLAAMLDVLQQQHAIALDTEANSLFVYRERVCLLQVSTREADYVIDTLALPDISGFGPIFANPAIEKVFHGADYDIGTLRRDYGFTFVHIFDTMIASRILGIHSFGLSTLLLERFQVDADKRMQRHDWGSRPLQPAELLYAEMDTHFLLALRDQLLQELQAQGREREAREAFERVSGATWNRKPFEAGDFWQIKGATALSDEGRGVLKELYALRDAEARRLDRPPFKIMSDRTLVALAEAQPHAARDLRDIAGLSAWHVRTLGQAILAAVREGLRHPQTLGNRPAREGRPDEEILERYEKLRAWRKERATVRGVEPDVLISNSLLMDIARHAPEDFTELRSIEGLGDYQLESYGDEILEIVK